MRVYRLSKERYKNDLSGMGAEKLGGRWNSKGTAMVYTSESRALAKLEVAVNLALHRLPKNYFLIIIEIPDNLIATYPLRHLKDHNWKNNPPIRFTQEAGDAFVENQKALALKVPSVVVEGDFNYLINPHHPKAKQLKIIRAEPFCFDMRLFK